MRKLRYKTKYITPAIYLISRMGLKFRNMFLYNPPLFAEVKFAKKNVCVCVYI